MTRQSQNEATHHSAYILMSFSRKSADRSTTLMCLGSWLMISCVENGSR